VFWDAHDWAQVLVKIRAIDSKSRSILSTFFS
jgi:hypothetical protein